MIPYVAINSVDLGRNSGNYVFREAHSDTWWRVYALINYINYIYGQLWIYSTISAGVVEMKFVIFR